MPEDHDAKLTDWLDNRTDELIDLACDLIRIPSVTGSEGELAQFLGDWLSKNGIAYEFSAIPETFRDTYPDFAGEQNLAARPNLYARLKGPDSSQESPVVLNGHLDVVPVGDVTRWRFDPFSAARSEGAIWGRGAADMKGPIAAGLMAMLAVKECGLSLARNIEFHLVISEEGGGLGTLFALSERPKATATIVLEPTRGRIVTAGAGALQFTVRAVGKAAHSCAPWEGRSALAMLRHCLTRLEGYAAQRNASLAHPLFAGFPEHVPLAIGTFSAGEWRGILPESGYFSGRMGLLPGEEIAAIRSQLEDEVARCRDELQVRPQDLTIDWPNVGFPAWETVENSALIDGMQAAAGKLGHCADPTGVVFGADAGFIARNGIPVAMYGPGDIAVAHMVDEHVLERDVADAAKTLALTLARLAT